MELMLSQVNLAVQELSNESLIDPARFSARRALMSTSRRLVKHHGAGVAEATIDVQCTLNDVCSSDNNGKLENDDEQKSRRAEVNKKLWVIGHLKLNIEEQNANQMNHQGC